MNQLTRAYCSVCQKPIKVKPETQKYICKSCRKLGCK